MVIDRVYQDGELGHLTSKEKETIVRLVRKVKQLGDCGTSQKHW